MQTVKWSYAQPISSSEYLNPKVLSIKPKRIIVFCLFNDICLILNGDWNENAFNPKGTFHPTQNNYLVRLKSVKHT